MSRPTGPRLKVNKSDGSYEWYRLVVLKVVEDDLEKTTPDGAPLPRTLDLLDDDEVAEIQGGERFVTAFVPECVFGPGK